MENQFTIRVKLPGMAEIKVSGPDRAEVAAEFDRILNLIKALPPEKKKQQEG